jgi:hypothetical protein
MRNSIMQGTNDEELQDLHDMTQHLQQEMLKNMNMVMVTLFKKYYWDDSIKLYWAQENCFFQILSDSLNNFLAVMMELLWVSCIYSWEYAKASLDYHDKKLAEIWLTALSQVNALASTYIYLQDAHLSKFNAPALQEKRNIYLFSNMAKLDHTMCVTVSPKCPKCGGNAQVHPVG